MPSLGSAFEGLVATPHLVFSRVTETVLRRLVKGTLGEMGWAPILEVVTGLTLPSESSSPNFGRVGSHEPLT